MNIPTISHFKQNLDWIASGKMGCTFAAYFARDPVSIGWKCIIAPAQFIAPPDCLILSIIFPEGDKASVKTWALDNGFYLETVGPGYTGLRYKMPEGISWVQYFGPDADVATRRCPVPMLTFTVRRSAFSYWRVGWKGILHIAHASCYHISKIVADRLWNTSHSNTARQIGHKPTIAEAAKTTYHENE